MKSIMENIIKIFGSDDSNENLYTILIFSTISEQIKLFKDKNSAEITLMDKEFIADYVIRKINLISLYQKKKNLCEELEKEIKIDLLNNILIDVENIIEKNDKYLLFKKLKNEIIEDVEDDNNNYQEIKKDKKRLKI